MGLLDHLRALVSLTGPSGREEDAVRFLRQRLEGLADEITVDALGNVIARRKGSQTGARSLMISAHMDEVGFLVRRLEPTGFLRFEKLGGHDDRTLLGQRVWVRGARGRLLGAICAKSVHLTPIPERDRPVKHTELYIDIGAQSADEARNMGVAVGDAVGYVSELAEVGLNSGRFIGKAIDDRAGCALLLHLLEELKEQDLPGDLYAIFSVQEEVGLRGARVAGQAIQADVALALDMTAADDTPDTGTRNLEIGKGPALKLMDASLLAHPAICRALTAAAERAGVPLQAEILTGIGTDAGALHQAGAGVPSGCLSVANRYTHSPVEMLDMRDLEGASQVLREFVLQLQQIDLAFAPDAK